jgi:sec-independent protein translocase protein TatA
MNEGNVMDIFSLPHLVILLLIVMALFGTSKIKNIGGDLGSAIKSFRQAMKEEEQFSSIKATDAAAKSLAHIREMEATKETITEIPPTKS